MDCVDFFSFVLNKRESVLAITVELLGQYWCFSVFRGGFGLPQFIAKRLQL